MYLITKHIFLILLIQHAYVSPVLILIYINLYLRILLLKKKKKKKKNYTCSYASRRLYNISRTHISVLNNIVRLCQ